MCIINSFDDSLNIIVIPEMINGILSIFLDWMQVIIFHN